MTTVYDCPTYALPPLAAAHLAAAIAGPGKFGYYYVISKLPHAISTDGTLVNRAGYPLPEPPDERERYGVWRIPSITLPAPIYLYDTTTTPSWSTAMSAVYRRHLIRIFGLTEVRP